MTLKFEPGCSYSTRWGRIAYVNLSQPDPSNRIYGHVIEEDGSRLLVCWYPNGHVVPNVDGRFDLIHPGIRMDARGPREITDPEYDVARLGPKKVHENVPDRLEQLTVRVVKLMNAVELNQSATKARFAKSDEEAALNLVATDARLDRLSGIINVQDQRLDTLENLPGLATLNAAVVDINDRLDRFALEIATKANAEGVDARFVRTFDKITELEGSIGADLRVPQRDNPVVIGRWINVFREASGSVVTGPATFSSQWAADQAAKQDTGNRVACIQINEAFG